MPQQGLYDFGRAFLTTLCSLIPFLERELIDTLPYMCCAMLPALPASLSQDIVNVICWHLIPFTICMRRPSELGFPFHVISFISPSVSDTLK